MTAVICIEVDYKDEALAAQQFPELEKVFVSKTNGTMVQLAKPKIGLNKSIVMVEFDLQHKMLAKAMLPVIRQQVCSGLTTKLKEQGYKDITIKCYLKKEVK